MTKKIVLLLLVSVIFSCEQKPEAKEILFVCTHGAARSPIAAAYFNKIAKEKDINFRAVFRGTEPDSALTRGTSEGLLLDDFEINSWKPEKVSENDITKAHRIVTFDCKLPLNETQTKTEQWNGTPPISKDYDKARDIIKDKVTGLVEKLSKK